MEDWTPPNTFAMIGAALGIYAAAISTWQEVRYLRDEKPRIRVSLSLGQILNISGDKEWKLFVNYVNVGKMPVAISSLVSIRINTAPGSKFALHASKYQLPHRLEVFSENASWVDLKSLKEIDWDSLENGATYWIIGRVTDASGIEHESVPYKLSRPSRPEKVIDLGDAQPS